MTDHAANLVTRVLQAAARGERQAADQLLPLVYDELRRLARARMSRLRAGQTLQPTALVHEAYMKIVGDSDPGWEHRGHFFAAAAKAMRDILVDQARRRASLKRGGARIRVDADAVEPTIAAPTTDILAVHEALERLEADDPLKREIINLHYFAGLSNDETAAALGVSLGTVEREWRFIRAWLKNELREAE